MLLMMGFSVVLMFFMPKMMDNLDPEQKEQMQKQMEMQSDPSKMLQQLWGDLSGAGDSTAAIGDVVRKKEGKGGKSTRRAKKE